MLKKRPAIATILNKRRDRIDIFKQKKSIYIGFKLDHVISSTNRMNALLLLHLSNSSSHLFLDPNPGQSYLQGEHLGVFLGRPLYHNMANRINMQILNVKNGNCLRDFIPRQWLFHSWLTVLCLRDFIPRQGHRTVLDLHTIFIFN